MSSKLAIFEIENDELIVCRYIPSRFIGKNGEAVEYQKRVVAEDYSAVFDGNVLEITKHSADRRDYGVRLEIWAEKHWQDASKDGMESTRIGTHVWMKESEKDGVYYSIYEDAIQPPLPKGIKRKFN